MWDLYLCESLQAFINVYLCDRDMPNPVFQLDKRKSDKGRELESEIPGFIGQNEIG